MTNKEKYKDEILKIAASGDRVAVVGGKPVGCRTLLGCTCCEFDGYSEKCYRRCAEWMESEADKEDWSKVPVDTPILVKHSEFDEWTRRYFAKYENNMVHTWHSGTTSWTATNHCDICGWEYAKLTESEGKYGK